MTKNYRGHNFTVTPYGEKWMAIGENPRFVFVAESRAMAIIRGEAGIDFYKLKQAKGRV